MAARPRPVVVDDKNIPPEGAFVLVANHYERPGLKVFWAGMLAANAIFERRETGRTLHWLMTSEWYGYRLGGIVPVPRWFLRWLFRRIATVYSLVIVPRSPEQVMGRAAAMRSILEVVEKEGEPIGLFPEGVGKDVLVEAMPGTGLFLSSLSKRGVPILPAGIYEENGVLTVRFGPPFRMQPPQGAAREERDGLAREQLMLHIGRLLPQHMWGTYTLAIEESLAQGGHIA
jgi:1-acyl-sn-glycerol-3-phosphate acyltransferase